MVDRSDIQNALLIAAGGYETYNLMAHTFQTLSYYLKWRWGKSPSDSFVDNCICAVYNNEKTEPKGEEYSGTDRGSGSLSALE